MCARSSGKKWAPPNTWSTIPLLYSESSIFAGGANPPVSALSFFDCTDPAFVEDWLKLRIAEIATANQWIIGRLVNLDGKQQLACPPDISDKDMSRLLLVSPEGFAPLPSMSPQELSLHYQKIELPSMGAAYDKEAVLASRFVTSRTPRGLCVLFTMSHVVGDGISFYAILNMLSPSCSVTALSPLRKPQFDDPKTGAAHVLGVDMNAALMRPASVTSMLMSMATGTPRLLWRVVDEAALSDAKAAAKAAGAVPFVSSNDVLTSAFSRAVGASDCIMAINMRGKVDGITSTDAGNYENGLVFDAACSSTPSGVRRALLNPSFTCRQSPLPPFWAAFSTRFALISNWASGSQPLDLPHCTEVLHQPVFNIDTMAGALPFDVAMIFRTAGRKGRLGLMWFTRKGGEEQDFVASLPLCRESPYTPT
jgi:hypothetical protein